MVVYDVLTFLQTMAFVCSTCGKAYSTNQNLARHSETHQDTKACHCGEVFTTSEELKEHKRAKHDIPAQSALTQLFSQANLAY
jgi:DNA-directed RNA polymerase subunit RPC12/RpoP